MADNAFEPKLGRIRDSKSATNLTTTRRIVTQAGRAGAGLVRSRGHVAPDARRRGLAPGLLARAGLIAPGSRRVIVRARYSRQRAGDLGAAKAHLRYIQRDGIKRRIPFVLYSGYCDLQESFPKHVILQKPAHGESLLAAIAELLSPTPAGRCDAELSVVASLVNGADVTLPLEE
jgi:hypothetical protein